MVLLSHLYKTYGRDRHILKNVHLKINRQDLTFLMGPSGAGKTTLFRIITGFESATSGSVRVNNFYLDRIPPSKVPYFRRTIGVVYQDFRLLSDRTIFENVALPMQIMGRHRWHIEEEVSKILDKLGLAHRRSEYPDCLSGGEKQRIAIARALVHNPPLLIADEPTGNLDANLSEEIMQLFEKANAKGTTIIIATHDRAMVEKRKKKRIIEISRGTLIEKRKKTAWDQPLIQLDEAGLSIL